MVYTHSVTSRHKTNIALIDPPTVFSAFDVDQLGTKIRRHRFKERVKLIKMLHSGKDLLKTSEDIVPESLEILHLDGRDGGGGGS